MNLKNDSTVYCLFEQDVEIKPKKTIVNTSDIYERSLISESYALNFIKEFIL